MNNEGYNSFLIGITIGVLTTGVAFTSLLVFWREKKLFSLQREENDEVKEDSWVSKLVNTLEQVPEEKWEKVSNHLELFLVNVKKEIDGDVVVCVEAPTQPPPAPSEKKLTNESTTTPVANCIVKAEEENKTEPKKSAEELYERYKKMLKIGIPREAVILKMKSEDYDPQAFFAREEKQEEKKELPAEYERFAKMLKMGVPKEAVMAKMKQEKLDIAVLFSGEVEEETKKEKKLLVPAIAEMKQVSSSSIWNEKQFSIPLSISPGSKEKLREAFTPKKTPKKEKKKVEPIASSLIPARRSQNVAIGLAKYKMATAKLVDVITTLNAHKTLDEEKLELLLMILPNEEERKIMKEASSHNPSNECENFFHCIATQVPDAAERIEALLLMNKLPKMMEKLRERMKEMTQAMEQVKQSKQVKKYLKTTLYVIDLLNSREEEVEVGGKKKEAISVIGLSEKIANVKTFDGSALTLCDLIVSVLQKSNEEEEEEEEELFTRSAQCSFSNLKKELKEIETFLNKIKQIISCEEEKKQAQSLSNELSECEASYKNLLEMYGENESIPFDVYFENLKRFIFLIKQGKEKKNQRKESKKTQHPTKSSMEKDENKENANIINRVI